MKYIMIYLILINAFSLLLMILDKYKARRNLWRIPERVLLGAAAIGGSVGALAGMYLVRHKTKHLHFSIGIPVMLVIQVIAGIWILNFSR